MSMVSKGFSMPTERIKKLKAQILNATPCIESERALLITESYKESEGKPAVIRRALALEKILNGLPVIIREDELIVGSLTKEPRSSQVFPEFSNKWLKDEFDRIGKRNGDSFQIAEEDKKKLGVVFEYWDGKTTNELATSYMSKETIDAMNAGIFTVGNYYYNGVGHISVDYGKVLKIGYMGIIKQAIEEMEKSDKTAPEYIKKEQFLKSVIIACKAAIDYAKRYSQAAIDLAERTYDAKRKAELIEISKVCSKVPAQGAESFYEACQAFWFVHAIIGIESNGHSISPTRFDQYMYPYYKNDIETGKISKEFAQELIDSVWIKLNDINKVRDEVSTNAFGGYPMFQNLIVGGQNSEGKDATNELSYMALEATAHVRLSQPSLSVRIWNKSPEEFLLRSCELTRLGLGIPAYYNDEVIIPALVDRGLTLADARDYGIIGCVVEPQKPGKTEGWHDSAFFNLARIIELAINGGKDKGKQIGPVTKDFTQMTCFEDFVDAYTTQMEYFVKHMCIADNCVDIAHGERAPLPFLSAMVEDCIGKGKSLQEGGAHYNFTGPQGVGVANVGDSLIAIKKLVFDEKKITLCQLKEALDTDFGGCSATSSTNDAITSAASTVLKGVDSETYEAVMAAVKKVLGDSSGETLGTSCSITSASANISDIKQLLIKQAPKFGNDIDEVDELAREGALIYCREGKQVYKPKRRKIPARSLPCINKRIIRCIDRGNS